MTSPARLPDAASLGTILGSLDPAVADSALTPALAKAFPGFDFNLARIDDDYWRDTRSVIRPDGSRVGDLRQFMMAELDKEHGDLGVVWRRLKDSDLLITEWRGTSVFVSAPTSSGPMDYLQITLCREIEWRAGPIVDPSWPPRNLEELCDPSGINRDNPSPADLLHGPVYRLRGRSGSDVVHVRSFLDRVARMERERREARRPEIERRVIREIGPHGATETPFLRAVPDWFDFVPREVRFFRDWEESSASAEQVFPYWALDIHDYEHKGQREIGFIPRPLRTPAERLVPPKDVSPHILMDRIETIDRSVGVQFGWFFLMTHGYWVDVDVGHAIAGALRARRLRLPDRDAAVLLRWADNPYGF